MLDYKDKIKKLLALAESSNEHEAKSALLKARKMMADHKLTEADIMPTLQDSTVLKIETEITYSPRRNPWVPSLAATVATNYCCRSVSYRKYHCSTRRVTFIGLADDAELTKEVFLYTYGFIMNKLADIKKRYKKFGTERVNSAMDSYACGFCDGLINAFRQQDEEGWGLVMAEPEAVTDYFNNMNARIETINSNRTLDRTEWANGVTDGKDFTPNGIIGNGQ